MLCTICKQAHRGAQPFRRKCSKGFKGCCLDKIACGLPQALLAKNSQDNGFTSVSEYIDDGYGTFAHIYEGKPENKAYVWTVDGP